LRTSTSSSTSDDPRAGGGAIPPARLATDPEQPVPRRGARRALTAIRLVHPFPSILDGSVVAAVALVAGGTPGLAATLGLSMTLLQFSIGALNDVVDAPLDAGRKPGKPIPAGIVSLGVARVVVISTALAGLLLSTLGAPALAIVALVGLGVGLWYDLRAKGTVTSWLPLVIGIPLLPVYGWYGATGSLPAVFLVIIPAAAVAGAALAIANEMVDMERDAAAGGRTIAIALGGTRAGLLVAALFAGVAILAVATVAALGAPVGATAAVLATALVPVGAAVAAVVAGARPGTAWRERAWEAEAVGTGLLAIAWLGALALVPGGPPG